MPQIVPPYDRENLARRVGESWQPPPFDVPGEKPVREFLRRFFDLQAASIWRDISAQLPLATGKILDVGCGAQPYRHLLGPAATYHGIDHESAKTAFHYDQPNTTYFSGDRWPVNDQSVDFLMATETLEHVPRPQTFLAEAKRVVKSGGTLFLTVPFSARWHFIPHDYWRYSPSCLVMLLSDAGFDDIAVFARGNAVTVACYKTIAIFLPLLMPQAPGVARRMLLRIAGLPFAPLVVMLAVIANISLRGKGSDDCLGYTAIARRV